MATHQRSRSAVLSGAKIVITEVGTFESNMLDIAARAQVSRATVYNHFSDKEEMMMSLLESEIRRIAEAAKKAGTKRDALYVLSTEISQDQALRTMVRTDPEDIAKFVTRSDHQLWTLIDTLLQQMFGESAGTVLRWLIGQVASPLTLLESARQADQMVRSL